LSGCRISWLAAATSYANHGETMIPFYIFYSMFGFQRVGDLIWQAADARTRGFLLGATAGRTTLNGEELPAKWRADLREGDVLALLGVGTYNRSMHLDHCLRPPAGTAAFADRL